MKIDFLQVKLTINNEDDRLLAVIDLLTDTQSLRNYLHLSDRLDKQLHILKSNLQEAMERYHDPLKAEIPVDKAKIYSVCDYAINLFDHIHKSPIMN